jgi:CubicO group peptidase (beta-lactamase class C family)
MHVVSSSKLVTAMAMTKLLNERGISLDTPIIGYLPDYWTEGPGIERITFRHLLTHRSGLMPRNPFVPAESSFPAMRDAIAAGSSGVGTRAYRSVNYGLCRVLLAIVNQHIERGFGTSGPSPLLRHVLDALWDRAAIDAYV